MTLPPKDTPAGRLRQTARKQQGHFTTRQAIEAGFPQRLHSTQVRRGEWSPMYDENNKVVRHLKGIYRLSDYPVQANEYRMVWYLWTDRKGVFSHETAADILNLGDVIPSKLEFTVPPGFRKKAPEGMALFRERLDPKEVRWFRGLPVTVPLRICFDLLRSDIVLTWIGTVVADALKKRLVTRRSVEALLPRLDARHREDAETILKEIWSAL